jgi:formate dehydrogenase subunit delta
MSAEHLVQMVNDIANFFHSESDHAVAVDGVANHLRKFWDPRMCRQILAHWQDHDGQGLNELGRAAVAQLAAATPAQH